MPSLNPYTSRTMLTNMDMFFGREIELRELFTFINNAQSCSIVGERRIGKSSLLYALTSNEIREKYTEFNLSKISFAYCDLSSRGFYTIPQLFAEWLNLWDKEHNPKYTNIDYEEFEEIISQLAEKQILVLLLDEFDDIIRYEQYDLDFFKFLRSLANRFRVSYITITHRELYSLDFQDETILTSPFFNIFNTLYLTLLDEKSAINLLTHPLLHNDWELDETLIKNLIDYTGAHPYLLQIMGYALWELIKQKNSVIINQEDIMELENIFYEKAEGHFIYLWNRATNTEEHQILYALYNNRPAPIKILGRLRRLRRYGLVVKNQIFSNAFAEYIMEHKENLDFGNDNKLLEVNKEIDIILTEGIEKIKEIHLEKALTEINNFLTCDISLLKTLSSLNRLAKSESTVLITGESGTGKELIARALAENSNTPNPYIALNCAAINADLLETELFGYVKGAFTGADNDKIGKFVAADGGTLFLDEIGEMPLILQAKILRVLQFGEYQPLGDTKTHKVKVRLLAATNRNLEMMIREGNFRMDLYYRLNVLKIHIPPLRERKQDIPYLIAFFIMRFNQKLNISVKYISRLVLEAFIRWNWEGNVRELEHLLESIMTLQDFQTIENNRISLSQLPMELRNLIEEKAGKEERKETEWIRLYSLPNIEDNKKVYNLIDYNKEERENLLLDFWKDLRRKPYNLAKALRENFTLPNNEYKNLYKELLSLIENKKIYPHFSTNDTSKKTSKLFWKCYNELKKLHLSENEIAQILLHRKRLTLLRYRQKLGEE